MPTYANLPILVLLFLSLAFSERCHPNDKKALLEIKNALNNPYDLISWDPKADCCDWLVVKCDDKTNRITQFDLSQSDLNLPIPTAVGDLKYLESLTFHHTNLTGQIPQAISKLSQLNFLDLRWNHLTGPVPSFLGQLKKLTYIGLSFNNLTGSIPGSLSNLPKLGGLLLDRNKLTGSIPESFADFREKDFYLYLSHNQLTGEIPRKLGHTNFTWIDVSRNRFEGDVSFLFGKNKSIGVADFSRNMLRFDMSNVEFPKSLTNLDLNHNRITGRLPEGLAEIDLISLNVSYNRLCGRIPTGGRLQEFDYTSYFHNRCLCGAPLPKCK
ncbi:polygalacturonase inhibitor [Phtheirospermum japonicum]|uniref:Polygalacturonase inhibitor n=1 Tax=Phtheirospermum japonicum TaxID=374723 RepID=A0A830DA54_9LAMI|nr:polygalacturonase inhibitor [Phtheirospermum japonicum]